MCITKNGMTPSKHDATIIITRVTQRITRTDMKFPFATTVLACSNIFFKPSFFSYFLKFEIDL